MTSIIVFQVASRDAADQLARTINAGRKHDHAVSYVPSRDETATPLLVVAALDLATIREAVGFNITPMENMAITRRG